MMKEIIVIIGFAIIWGAVHVGRDRPIKLFSRNWWLILFMISIGAYIIENAYKSI